MANTDEESFVNKNPHVTELEAIAQNDQSEVVSICAKLEEDISTFDEADKHEFLTEIGVDKTGLEKFVSKSYELLNLISFLTAGPKEVKAWTITSGSTAPQAAGKIHSDFERGFIRAEVTAYDDFVDNKGHKGAQEAGKMRLEGKEYVMADGDVVLFRFNV